METAAARKATIASGFANATSEKAIAAWVAMWDLEALMELHEMSAALRPDIDELLATSKREADKR